MHQQFATAKAFAGFVCNERWGRSRVIKLNKMVGLDRIEAVTSDLQRYARWEFDGIQFEYMQAAYGLYWSLRTDRVDGKTELAIRTLNCRQLCELVHELMIFHYDIGLYAQYLYNKYAVAA